MSSLIPWLDIRSKIEAAAVLPPELTEWPNENFRQPIDKVWMSVEAAGDLLQPIGVDGVAWQETGRLYVHIFTPTGQGTVAARTLADKVAAIFRGIPGPNTVVYYGGSIGVGQTADAEGNWWMLTVAWDWRFQRKTVLTQG